MIGLAAGPGSMGPHIGFKVTDPFWISISVIPVVSPDFSLLHGGLRLTQDLAHRDDLSLYLVESVGVTFITDAWTTLSGGVGVGVRSNPSLLSGISLWGEVKLSGLSVLGETFLILPLPSAGVEWYF